MRPDLVTRCANLDIEPMIQHNDQPWTLYLCSHLAEDFSLQSLSVAWALSSRGGVWRVRAQQNRG